DLNYSSRCTFRFRWIAQSKSRRGLGLQSVCKLAIASSCPMHRRLRSTMRKYFLAACMFLAPFLIGLLFVAESSRTPHEYHSYWKVARPIGPNHQSQSDDLHLPSGVAAALRLLLNDQRLQGNHLQG